ncbi:MAG: hypothetical protein ACRDL7_06245 [Gaiellaceae bacterium]
MIDAVATAPEAPKRSTVAAVLGVLSVALLGASFVWAHHWGVQADALVVCWAVATIGSLVVSVWILRDDMVWPTRFALRLAKIGLAGGIVSILALVVAGVAYAAGINPTGACGGG